MNLSEFLTTLKTSPQDITFADTMSVIEENYLFQETQFTNGDTVNAAGENSGSCKLFAFAKLNQLDPDATLSCFGDYYRKDVLENPDGTDHANIRNFMKYGWDGIDFSGEALSPK
ncbi:MAG: HopJ type III effector protein [Verrucomicrobiota bacterium]